jgi:hypothetical protein
LRLAGIETGRRRDLPASALAGLETDRLQHFPIQKWPALALAGFNIGRLQQWLAAGMVGVRGDALEYSFEPMAKTTTDKVLKLHEVFNKTLTEKDQGERLSKHREWLTTSAMAHHME